jgi:phage anti-repressor protein
MLQNFNKDTAIELLQQQKSVPFPVDFDQAWQWLGYTRKDNAKESFTGLGFVEGMDFSSFTRKTPQGGRPSESIQLTVDCFKSWGMMAGTEKGKEIRKYFLECERIAVAATSNSQPLPDRYPEVAVKSVAESIATVQRLVAPIDPRLAQVLIDHAMRGVDQLALPGNSPRLAGVVEIAESLGYNVGKNESSLGRSVARCWRDAFGTAPQEVKRECGGAFRALKVYPIDEPVVITAIRAYFQDRN